MPAASGSSRSRICALLWTSVTFEPSRAEAFANSQPMGPPPSTIVRDGSAVGLKTFSLVSAPESGNPGMSGSRARAPVATPPTAESKTPSVDIDVAIVDEPGVPEEDVDAKSLEASGAVVGSDAGADATEAVPWPRRNRRGPIRQPWIP